MELILYFFSIIQYWLIIFLNNAGARLVVSGDGRYFSKEAIQVILPSMI